MDLNTCSCANPCNRSGSGRGACCCRNEGRFCTSACSCGRPKVPCINTAEALNSDEETECAIQPTNVLQGNEHTYSLAPQRDKQEKTPVKSRTKCIVKGCRSGLNTKENEGKTWFFFGPPMKNKDLLEKWEEMIKPKSRLTASSRVCHEHFPENMLIKRSVITTATGQELAFDYIRWRLTKDAFPCIFTRSIDVPTWLVQMGYVVPTNTGNAICETANSKIEGINLGNQTKNVQNKKAKVGGGTEIISTGTQTEDKKYVCREVQTKTDPFRFQAMYRRWKSKYFNLFNSVEKKKKKLQPPPVEGVFVAFSNLNDKEKMFANALARKSRTKTPSGMRYSARHMVEALSLAGKGRKAYRHAKDNCGQVLPSYRMVQRMRSMMRSKVGPNGDVSDLVQDETANAIKALTSTLQPKASKTSKTTAVGETDTSRLSDGDCENLVRTLRTECRKRIKVAKVRSAETEPVQSIDQTEHELRIDETEHGQVRDQTEHSKNIVQTEHGQSILVLEGYYTDTVPLEFVQ